MRHSFIAMIALPMLAACQPGTGNAPAETANPNAVANAGALPAADPLKTEPPAPTDALVHCGADKVQSYVGKDATPTVRSEVAQKSGAANIRWITPEMMVTQDYRQDRLNVHLGTDNKIGSVNCG